MLTVALVDAQLELIPSSITNHVSVVRSARKRGKPAEKMLLDSSLHHSAMQKLPDANRRGRPDIVHVFIMLCLDSILNQMGELRCLVHTVNDQLITVAPETRIPRNYNRFVGLMEQLFEKKSVPEDSPLLTLREPISATDFVEECRCGGNRIVLFSERGREVRLSKYFKELKESSITCLVGGFPHGDFAEELYTLADDVLSIYPTNLKAWTVTAEILVNYKNALLS
jgi:rRNA small subunit pseudouridine methyltransferase Nep1